MDNYNKINWKDHIVETPLTFIQQNNNDGTVTLIAQEGEVLQLGTPVNARNLDNMDEGILQNRISVVKALDSISSLEIEVSTLKDAVFNNFTNNIFVEDFENIDDITILNGVYDTVGKRMVV